MTVTNCNFIVILSIPNRLQSGYCGFTSVDCDRVPGHVQCVMCDMTKWWATDHPIVVIGVTSCLLSGCWYESFIWIRWQHQMIRTIWNWKIRWIKVFRSDRKGSVIILLRHCYLPRAFGRVIGSPQEGKWYRSYSSNCKQGNRKLLERAAWPMCYCEWCPSRCYGGNNS